MYTVNHERAIDAIKYKKVSKSSWQSHERVISLRQQIQGDISKAPKKSYSVLSEKVLLYIEN